MARAYVGTSGWQYKHWKDSFYEGLPKRRWLERIGRTFTSVEVNGTFYSLPKPDSVQAWTQEVPSRFRFATKMWRGVTHYRKLKDASDLMRRFFRAIEPLSGQQRGPLLVQLPPGWHADAERLDAFLKDLHETTRPQRWKVAVEFRDPTWLDEPVFDVLEHRRAAAVVHDMEKAAPNDEPGEASFVYVRRHGPRGDMSKGYSSKQVQADARRVRRWNEEGRTVFVYYNNDVRGDAPRDARSLMEAIGGRAAR